MSEASVNKYPGFFAELGMIWNAAGIFDKIKIVCIYYLWACIIIFVFVGIVLMIIHISRITRLEIIIDSSESILTKYCKYVITPAEKLQQMDASKKVAEDKRKAEDPFSRPLFDNSEEGKE